MKADATQKRILNALLDKYERSSFFRENIKPTRRIMLIFYSGGKSDFAYYNIEQSERRISVNRAVERLEAIGLMGFDWMKGEYGHIIEKVWLIFDKIATSYELTSREPKGDSIENICKEIEHAGSRVVSAWASTFLSDAYEEITRKRSITSIIPSDKRERDMLLQAIIAIDGLKGGEYMERVFSLGTFGDTKAFERTVKPRFLRILRKYLDSDDDAVAEDVLKQVGIVKYPEQFEFCGAITLDMGSGRSDFSCLPGGSVVYSSDVSEGNIFIGQSVKSVMTIENRANYVDYIQKRKENNEIVIYHGGQFSPRKGLFMSKIAKALPDGCDWQHWGDIDYGGFMMLLRLRRQVMPSAIPYRMNTSELERYKEFAAPIKDTYVQRLMGLKSFPELYDCYDCIDYMAEKMIRLEQEAMLTDL